MIERSILSTMSEVSKRKADAEQELQRLGLDPSTDSSRRQCYNWYIGSLVTSVQEATSGNGPFKWDDCYSWQAKVQSLYTKFAEDVLALKLENIGEVAE